MSPNTKPVASRIDADSKTKLTLAAEQRGVSLSAYLETVIEEHIDRNPRGLRSLESHFAHKHGETSHSRQDEPPDDFIEEMLGGLK